MRKSDIDGLVRLQEEAYNNQRISEFEYHELKAIHQRLYKLSEIEDLSVEQHMEIAELSKKSSDIIMRPNSGKPPSRLKTFFKQKMVAIIIGLLIGLTVFAIEKW